MIECLRARPALAALGQSTTDKFPRGWNERMARQRRRFNHAMVESDRCHAQIEQRALLYSKAPHEQSWRVA